MSGCKRPAAASLAVLAAALAAPPGAAAEGMRILTFVPGVAHGRLPVTVDLGASLPPAELLLNGAPACRVTTVRQTCLVDLGPTPRVALLELVRRDAAGRVAERARRWVNKPSDARAEVLVRSDCTRAAGPCTLRFSWSHENAIAPAELTVTIDGVAVYQGEPRDVPVPFAAERTARVVGVNLVFLDGERAAQTLLIGSGVSSAVEAPLNAVPVLAEAAGGRDPSALRTLGGRVVATVEPGEMEVLFVVAPSAAAKLQTLTREAQRTFSRNAGRMGKALEGVNHVVYFSPLGTRVAYSSASQVSDRLFRVRGFDCTPRHDYRERTLSLPCVDADLLKGDQYRLAATVVSATFNRAAVPRRRAVVVVLGDDEPLRDESTYGPADVRRYLGDILVPLDVWRLGRAEGGGWPAGRRISSAGDVVRAWETLRAGLDAQRICWIAEDLDPSAFRLAPEDSGIVLAGRDTRAAPVEVASAAEAEERRVPGPAAAAGPGRSASQKSVAATQEVALVSLDAFVTDGRGRRVTGLAASDFTLKVGGKPVAITNFSEYASPRPAGAAPPAVPPAAAAERPKRRVVLFVDHLTLGDARRSARFFSSLKDFVARTIQAGDEAAVLTFDESLATRVPFTGDTGSLLAALDALAKESARPPRAFGGTETVENLVSEIAQAEREIAAREERNRRGGGPPPPPVEAKAPQPAAVSPMVISEARGLAMQEWNRTKRKAAALRSVLASLGGMDGRRVLVVASHRLSRFAGMEYFLTKRLDVDVVIPPEAREIDARDVLESLAEAANGYGVTLHGLYPEAGGDFDLSVIQSSTPQFTGQPMNGRRGTWIDANESDGLHIAVDPTGGVVGLGAEAAGDALDGAAADLESYYSLGFPAEGIAAGRPLAVDLKVAAPGASVRTRRAVARRSAEDRAADRTVSNLFSRAPVAGFPITTRVTSALAAEKGRLRVAYEVTVPAASLALLPAPGGSVAKIAAFVALLDGGDVTQAPPARREFRTGEDAFADASGHFTFTGEAVVAPGSTISIGILDEATQESGYGRIDVPGGAKK